MYQTILFKHPDNEPTVCPHNDGSLLRSTLKNPLIQLRSSGATNEQLNTSVTNQCLG